MALAAGDRLSVVPAGPAAEDSLGETLTFDRQGFFSDLINRLRNATPVNQIPPVVEITGAVRLPGEYPITTRGSVDDVILMAGGFTPDADRSTLELIQRTDVGFDVQRVGLRDATTVNPGSELIVRIDSDQQNLTDVTVQGFVRYPGTYRMPKGSRVSDLIERAGGLLPESDLRAAVFSRERLRAKEQEQLERLRQDAEQTLAQQQIEQRSLTEAATLDSDQTAGAAQLLAELGTVSASGRLVINLPEILAGRVEQDVLLEAGDRLSIPSVQQSVTVLGSVLYPTAHVHELGVSPAEYITRSGGFSRQADETRAFVIRANGMVEPLDQGGWA